MQSTIPQRLKAGASNRFAQSVLIALCCLGLLFPVLSKAQSGPVIDSVVQVLTPGVIGGPQYMNGDFEFYIPTSWGAAQGFIAKYDRNGVIQWARAVRNNANTVINAYVRGISSIENGVFYITGTFAGPVNMGDSVITNTYGGQDMFIAKMDVDGNFLWFRKGGSAGYDWGTRILQDKWGNVFVSGGCDSLARFGSYTAERPGEFCARYDGDGNIKWLRMLGRSYSYNAHQASATLVDSSIYCAGTFSRNSTIGDYSIACSATTNIYLCQLDYDGKPLSLKRYSGTSSINEAYAITHDADNDLYMCGIFVGTINFDGASVPAGSWGNNGYTVKLSPTLRVTSVAEGRNMVCRGNDFDITYKCGSTFNSGNIFQVQLSDTSGSFSSPVIIGRDTATTSGTVTCTLSDSILAGKKYRLRIVSTNPAKTGEEFSSNFRISTDIPATPVVLTPTSDTGICSSFKLNLGASSGDNNIYWYTQPTGGSPIGWSVSGGNHTFVPSDTLTYYAQAENGCVNNERVATGRVTVHGLPEVPGTPTSNTPQCYSNGGITITAVDSVPTGETWYWQTSAAGTSLDSSAATYRTLNSGTYYIRSRNNTSHCFSATAGKATVSVVLPAAPTSVLPTAKTICRGTAIVLNATSAGNTINWYTQSTGGSIVASSNSGVNDTVYPTDTTYYYAETLTSGGCKSITRTSSGRISVNQLPSTPNHPTSNSPACSPVVATRPGSAPAGVYWTWQTTPSGASLVNYSTSYNVYTAGTYYLRAFVPATNCWSILYDSVIVPVVHPLPATPDATYSSNSPQCSLPGVTITRTGSPPAGETWYWQTLYYGASTANSTSTHTATSSSNYMVRSKKNDSTQCWGNASPTLIPVTVYPAAAIPSSVTPSSVVNLCGTGNMVNLSAVSTGNTIYWYKQATGGILYDSSASGATLTVTPDTTVRYYAEGRTSLGCPSTGRAAAATMIVYSFPSTPANPTSNSPQCAGNVTLTRSGTVPSGEAWYWQTSPTGTATTSSGTTYTATTSGTYYIRARNTTSGCWSIGAGSVTVVANAVPSAPSAVTPSSATAICAGQSINLKATSAGNTIYWYTASTGGSSIGSSASDSNFVVSPSTNTTYYAQAQAGGACNSTSRTATGLITVNALPSAPTAPAAQSYCSDTSHTFTFSSVTAGAGGNQIEWATNSSFTGSTVASSPATISHTVASAGRDTIWIRSKASTAGCISESVMTTVKVNSKPLASIMPPTAIIHPGESANLSGSGGVSFYWIEPNSTDQNITVTPPADSITSVYSLVVTDSLGCTDTASISVSLDPYSSASSFSVPFFFEKNLGQFDTVILYRARAGNSELAFLKNEVSYFSYLRSEATNEEDTTTEALVWNMEFDDANSGSFITPIAQKEFFLNYYVGSDSTQWKDHVPVYDTILMNNVYDNISVKYYPIDGGNLKYDILVAPHADIAQVKMKYKGVESLYVLGNGDLQVNTVIGSYTELKPVAYQYISGIAKPVYLSYSIVDSIVSFHIDSGYDENYALIIDPLLLVWSTFTTLPNQTNMYVETMDVDGNGVYFGGGGGGLFPITTVTPKYYKALRSLKYTDKFAFIAALNPNGSSLKYITVYGGFDRIHIYNPTYNSVLVMKVKNNVIHAGGQTGASSLDYFFLSATNAILGNICNNNCGDNFLRDITIALFKTSDGTALYSNTLGGNAKDYITDIDVDNLGRTVVTGVTTSVDFRAWPDANSLPNPVDNQEKPILACINTSNNTIVYFNKYHTSNLTGLPGGYMGYFNDILIRNDDIYVCGATTATSVDLVNNTSIAGVTFSTSKEYYKGILVRVNNSGALQDIRGYEDPNGGSMGLLGLDYNSIDDNLVLLGSSVNPYLNIYRPTQSGLGNAYDDNLTNYFPFSGAAKSIYSNGDGFVFLADKSPGANFGDVTQATFIDYDAYQFYALDIYGADRAKVGGLVVSPNTGNIFISSMNMPHEVGVEASPWYPNPYCGLMPGSGNMKNFKVIELSKDLHSVINRVEYGSTGNSGTFSGKSMFVTFNPIRPVYFSKSIYSGYSTRYSAYTTPGAYLVNNPGAIPDPAISNFRNFSSVLMKLDEETPEVEAGNDKSYTHCPGTDYLSFVIGGTSLVPPTNTSNNPGYYTVWTTSPTDNNIISYGNGYALVSPHQTTTYTLTLYATNSNGGEPCEIATDQVTVYISEFPTATIEASGNPCPSQLTLSATEISTAAYHWSTGATTRYITAATAGSYTVTITTTECTVTLPYAVSFDNVTVKVKASPDVTSICSGEEISLSAQPSVAGSYTYAWSNSSTSLGTSTTVELEMVNSNPYCVTLTESNECTSSACTSIGSITGCCVPTNSSLPSSPEVTNQNLTFGSMNSKAFLAKINSLFPGQGFVSGSDLVGFPYQISINGELRLDGNLTIKRCPNITFGPGASIYVPAAYNLSILGSNLYACGNRLWRGIIMEPGAHTIAINRVGPAPIIYPHIKDAQYGVLIQDNNIVKISDAYFENNLVGCYMKGSVPSTKLTQPANFLFARNRFSASDILQGYPGMVNASNQPYEASFSGFYAGLGFAGIQLDNINSFTIGGNNISAANYFRNMINGVISHNSNVNILQNSFDNIIPSNNVPYPLTGNSIYADAPKTLNGGLVRSLMETGFGSDKFTSPITFYGDGDAKSTAIYTENVNLDVQHNRIGYGSGSEMYTGILSANFSFNSSMIVNDNYISYRKVGILSGQSNEGSYAISNNVLSQTGEIYNHGHTGIHVGAVGPPIWLSREIVSNKLYLNGKQSTANAGKGITISGVNIVDCSDNTILLMRPEYSLEGVSFYNCDKVVGEYNYITTAFPDNHTATVTNLDNAAWPCGIYSSGSSGIFGCNSLEALHVGVKFYGVAQSSLLSGTHFNWNPKGMAGFGSPSGNSHYGLVISDGTTIGAQFHTQNQWFNGFDNNAGAYNANTNQTILRNTKITTGSGTTDRPDDAKIFPAAGGSSSWFQVSGSEDGSDCNFSNHVYGLVEQASTSLTELERDIIRDNIEFDNFNEELIWQYRQLLYTRLRGDASLIDSSNVEDFYIGQDTGVIGQLARVDDLIRKAVVPDSGTATLLSSLRDSINGSLKRIGALDERKGRLIYGHRISFDSLGLREANY